MLVAASRWFATPPGRTKAVFTTSGRTLPEARLRQLLKRRHQRCLALKPPQKISGACRNYRARVRRQGVGPLG